MIKSYRSKRRKIQEEIALMDNEIVGLASDILKEYPETSIVPHVEPSYFLKNNLITD